MNYSENYLTVGESAMLLNVHPSFIYRRIYAGELEAIRLSARKIVIAKEVIQAFIAVRRTGADRGA